MYDVCIVGAGPAGLACLSALKSSYSLDTLTNEQIIRADQLLRGQQQRGRPNVGDGSDRRDNMRVCVIDSEPWMSSWASKFDALNISFLRSPTLVHPDLFDSNALLAYAKLHDREDELIESGCYEISSLLRQSQTQSGLWTLPSTRLFLDFCADLVESLPHDFIKDFAVDVRTGCCIGSDNDGSEYFEVTLATGGTIATKSVILALGPVGAAIVPSLFSNTPRTVQWYDPIPPTLSAAAPHGIRRILVIGGGLTAAQTAQKWASEKNTLVTLCSRRPLVERHFDLGLEWFDRTKTNKCMSDFYHQSVSERLNLIKSSRGGGSIPPIYMRDLEQLKNSGRLKCVVGEATMVKATTNHGAEDASPLQVSIDGQSNSFDLVVLACGVRPDCTANPLIRNIMRRWPTTVHGGFPCISEDMEWISKEKLFVAGALGSLNLGPDAGNLAGAKRAATIISNALSCRSWLRQSDVLQNRFDELLWSDSDSDSDSSDDEERQESEFEPNAL